MPLYTCLYAYVTVHEKTDHIIIALDNKSRYMQAKIGAWVVLWRL